MPVRCGWRSVRHPGTVRYTVLVPVRVSSGVRWSIVLRAIRDRVLGVCKDMHGGPSEQRTCPPERIGTRPFAATATTAPATATPATDASATATPTAATATATVVSTTAAPTSAATAAVPTAVTIVAVQQQ